MPRLPVRYARTIRYALEREPNRNATISVGFRPAAQSNTIWNARRYPYRARRSRTRIWLSLGVSLMPFIKVAQICAKGKIFQLRRPWTLRGRAKVWSSGAFFCATRRGDVPLTRGCRGMVNCRDEQLHGATHLRVGG